MDWTTVHERIAKAAHNAFMADEWDELPEGGIERAAWAQVAVAVVDEVQTMLNERAQK